MGKLSRGGFHAKSFCCMFQWLNRNWRPARSSQMIKWYDVRNDRPVTSHLSQLDCHRPAKICVISPQFHRPGHDIVTRKTQWQVAATLSNRRRADMSVNDVAWRRHWHHFSMIDERWIQYYSCRLKRQHAISHPICISAATWRSSTGFIVSNHAAGIAVPSSNQLMDSI